jgi:hypothetical protein
MQKAFLLLIAFFMYGAALAQTVSTSLTSGGTSTAVVVGTSNYHASEAIFLASEIGSSNFTTTTSAIRKIGFNLASASVALNIASYSIYMKNVSASTTTLSTGTYSLSGYTLVYSGNLVLSVTGWNTVTLTTPFTRTASSNLQILIIRNSNTTQTATMNTSQGNFSAGTSALTARLYNGTTAPAENSTSLTGSNLRFHIQLIAPPFANDAAVTGFANLPSPSCFNTGQSISVVLRNAGANTIPIGGASVALTVSGANSSTTTLTNTTALAYEATETITFTNVNVSTAGTSFINATVTLAGDGDATNNAPTNSSLITLSTSSTFPVNEGYEGSSFTFGNLRTLSGNRSLWRLNSAVTTSATGAVKNADLSDSISPRTGTRFLIFDSWSGTTSSAGFSGIFYGGCYNLTAAGGGNIQDISFWMTHDNSFNAALDSIYVVVSADRGVTWTKVGNGYQRYSASATVPTWSQKTQSLSAYAGQTVLVGLQGVSKFGNYIGIDDIVLRSTSSVAPVTLVSLTGKAVDKTNVLEWETASEMNNKGFDIERSTDGNRFETIGFVAGNGTTNKAQTYHFVDKHPLSMSYYRLKQLDNDGRFEYSKIVQIMQKSGQKLVAYPNPTSEVLNFVADVTRADYQIINLLGQTILRGSATTQIDVSALPKGTYWLKVGMDVAKFVKQ